MESEKFINSENEWGFAELQDSTLDETSVVERIQIYTCVFRQGLFGLGWLGRLSVRYQCWEGGMFKHMPKVKEAVSFD